MENTQLVNIETFKGLLSTAPTIYEQNNTSIEKATARHNELLEAITNFQKDEPMLSKESRLEIRNNLRTNLNNYLVALRKTYDLLKDRRTPITGLFDDFKKQFTAMESKIDPKGVNNMYSRFQEILNRWAKEDADESARVRAELQRTQAIESERIRLKSEAELQIRKIFLAHLDNEQSMLVKIFESLTLEKFDAQANFIRNYSPVYFITHFEAITPSLQPIYVDKSELSNIITNAKAGKFVEFGAEFKETIEGIQEIFVEKLASKKAELEEISAADEQKKAELLAAQQQRQADDAAALAKANEEKIQVAETQTQVNNSAMQANLMFDMQSQVQQAAPTQKIREGYNIKVLNAAGWLQIVAFYFEKEGLKKDVETLSKMKLESMKTFAEKLALKTGERIQNTAVVYEETYKALVK